MCLLVGQSGTGQIGDGKEEMYVCVSRKAGSSERLESKKWRVERAEARGSVEPVVKGLAA